MQRFSFFLLMFVLVVIQTGCRASHRCCCQPACYQTRVPDPAPLAEPAPPAAETARRSISDDDDLDRPLPELFDYDPAVPPTPAADLEA
jgi:hypothetical protein